MSRPLRIQYPGAWYHVMNRGANRNKIYFDEKDYALFLVVVREATQIFQVKLSAYCLMDNHYHLVVHTPEGNLARFLRHVDGVYTQRFNRIHRRDGPLFRGRYKAILIEADEYLKQLVRYVHLNPVQAKLVQDPAQYPWSSHKEYLKGKTSEGWLYSKEVLGQFSKRVSQSIKLYGEFIREGVDEATRKFYGAQKQAAILGTEGFIERMKERFLEPQDEHWNEEVVEKRGLQQESRMKNVMKRVCAEFKIKEKALVQSRRGKENVARKMAVLVGREQTGLSLNELGKVFGIRHYRTVGAQCYRLKKAIKERGDLKKIYERLSRECSPVET